MGTYHNAEHGELIVFTDVALNVIEGEQLVRRIPWADVLGYEPPHPAGEIAGVKLDTRDGSYVVPITGCHGPEGKFWDAFNLAMVFRSLLGR